MPPKFPSQRNVGELCVFCSQKLSTHPKCKRCSTLLHNEHYGCTSETCNESHTLFGTKELCSFHARFPKQMKNMNIEELCIFFFGDNTVSEEECND